MIADHDLSVRLAKPHPVAATPEVALLDLLQESLVVLDLAGRITRWNRASERIYGWRRDEVLGRSFAEMLGGREWPSLDQMIDMGDDDRCAMELRRLNARGDEVIICAQFILCRDTVGAPTELVETGIDVTAQRRAELEAKRSQAAVLESDAFYADMFHGSAFAAFHQDATEAWKIFHRLRAQGVTDFRGYLAQHPGFVFEVMDGIRIVDVNETTLRLFEAPDRSAIVGGTIRPFWFPERMEPLLGSLEAAYNNISTFQGLATMRTLAGNEIDVLFTRSASPTLTKAGQVLLAIVDMTDKVKAQNALAEMQTNFAHAARVSSLGELTASIAHEVNQPLAAITANGEAALLWLAHEPPEVDKLRGLAEEMIDDARRASDIVAHVRAMASPQAGRQERVVLSEIVDEALALLGSQMTKCGAVTALALQSDLPEVLGDPIQLQQVVVNLVLNALQAMAGRDDARVVIRTSAEAEHAVLMIEDNGPGIDAGHLGRLFDSFFTTKPDGMGIGLAICRTIVEAHGGAITASNLEAGGACFAVRIPIAPPA